VIFLLSFGVRFVLLIHYRHDIVFVGEAPRIAYALISKGQYADPYLIPTGPTAHTTPFFPVLLAGIYKIFGTGFAGQFARCLVIISGYSLFYAFYPTFASAFEFPRAVGLFTGLVAALVPVKRSFEVFRGWDEPWAAMMLALVLFVTLKRSNSPRRELRGAIWLGLCWGATLYFSFSLFSAMVGVLFVDAWSNRTLRVLRDVAITLVASMVVISPWLLRNHRQLHAWLMRSNFGLELRMSNMEHVLPSAELNTSPSVDLHPSSNLQEAMLVREMGEVNYGRRELHLAVTWIRGHPWRFTWLSVERFFYFWFGPPQHLFEMTVTTVYTLLGFAGLGFVRKRVGEIQFRLWCTALIIYPLLYYFFQWVQRYRVPIDWMIWLSAGLFVSVMVDKFAPGTGRGDRSENHGSGSPTVAAAL
jgi:hypothetical protein